MFSPSSAETNVEWGGKLSGQLTASCVRNIRTKNYQNLLICFQVTVENVGDVFEAQCILYNTVEINIIFKMSATKSKNFVQNFVQIFKIAKNVILIFFVKNAKFRDFVRLSSKRNLLKHSLYSDLEKRTFILTASPTFYCVSYAITILMG